MKKLLVTIFAAFFAYGAIFAQCNPYFSFEEGDEWVIENYNAKGKAQGKQVSLVKSVTQEGNKTIIVVQGTYYDKKGDEMMSSEIPMECIDGKVYVDMNRFVPTENREMEGMSINVEGDNLSYPSSFSVGDNLEEATFTIKMESDNPVLAKTMGGGNTMTIHNRKVEKQESISTPAGTFECYKISYDMKSEMNVMGFKKTFEFSGIDWISEDVGMVRSESYNKKGKLENYSELISYK